MKTWIKILLALFVTGVIAAVLIYVFIINKPHPDYENLKAEYSLPASELYKSFVTDQESANKKFLGKMVEIKGNLTTIEAPDSLVIAVFVFEQGDFGGMGIRCTMLPKFNADAAKLQPEGEISIKGYCTGYIPGSDVVLEQCSIKLNR